MKPGNPSAPSGPSSPISPGNPFSPGSPSTAFPLSPGSPSVPVLPFLPGNPGLPITPCGPGNPAGPKSRKILLRFGHDSFVINSIGYGLFRVRKRIYFKKFIGCSFVNFAVLTSFYCLTERSQVRS